MKTVDGERVRPTQHLLRFLVCTGLVFNGVRVLQLAAELDERVQLNGQLRLDSRPIARHSNNGLIVRLSRTKDSKKGQPALEFNSGPKLSSLLVQCRVCVCVCLLL